MKNTSSQNPVNCKAVPGYPKFESPSYSQAGLLSNNTKVNLDTLTADTPYPLLPYYTQIKKHLANSIHVCNEWKSIINSFQENIKELHKNSVQGPWLQNFVLLRIEQAYMNSNWYYIPKKENSIVLRFMAYAKWRTIVLETLVLSH